MVEISAQAVKAMRDQTGLPMMECKTALIEAEGNQELAVEILRKRGRSTAAAKAGRETSEGRIACHVSPSAGAMVELRCESAPVANNQEFRALAATLARELAVSGREADVQSLLGQPSRERGQGTLGDLFLEIQNRLRENMVLARVLRWEGTVGSYVHHDGRKAALIEVEGQPADRSLLVDLCMHIVAFPALAVGVEELDPGLVAKEREILTEQARARAPGKPEAILAKIADGLLRDFYAQKVLLEQPYARDSAKTVGTVVREAGLKVRRFARWQVGEEPA
ncbi:MAG: translation elongation factor Ts [Planctomycetes bacterium]|nr:translation elongation factor Ts [Planctomycetota bacterium]